jgi:hypothetical protein
VAPRRDDLEFRAERLVGELEAHLVVALAGAAVRDRVRTDFERVLDLALREDRSRHAGAEQVAPLVERHRAHARPHVVGEPWALQRVDAARHRARTARLLLEAAQLLVTLADVAAVRMHFAVVVLLQPRNDDRGVEAAGVGEDDLLLLAHGDVVGEHELSGAMWRPRIRRAGA